VFIKQKLVLETSVKPNLKNKYELYFLMFLGFLADFTSKI